MCKIFGLSSKEKYKLCFEGSTAKNGITFLATEKDKIVRIPPLAIKMTDFVFVSTGRKSHLSHFDIANKHVIKYLDLSLAVNVTYFSLGSSRMVQILRRWESL